MIRVKKFINLLVFLFIMINPGIAAEIHDAALKGDLNKVKLLLKNDPNLLNTRGRNGKAPLHWAAQGGHQTIVKFLIEKGAIVDCKNVADETPLHYASAMGHVELVKLLIDKGASLNSKTTNGDTSLQYSVQADKFEITQLLVNKGADVNVKNNNKRTPLDFASYFGREKIEQLLVSKGGIYTSIKDPVVICLSKKIYRITFPSDPRSNIGVSVGLDGILLVDTGYNKRAVNKLKTALNKFKSGKIKYIINTHLHWDHINGNSVGNDETVIIDYKKLEQMMSKGIIVRGKEPLKGQTGKMFEAYYFLRFNKEEIRLIPYPEVHSDADIIIHFTDSGVVHMGDLLLSQSFPSVGPKVEQYMNLLEKVTDIFPENERFISGHGRDLTMKEVKDYKKMLLNTIEIVKEGIKAGKTVEFMQKEKLLKDYEPYNTFIEELDTDYWINAIYECYKDKF